MNDMKKFIVGVDPGLQGAIAFLRPDGLLNVLDMPTKTIKVSGKRRAIIDPDRLCERFDRSDIRFVMIEEQSAMAKQGLSSTFKTGLGYGLILGMVAANYHKHETVRPQAWKKHLSVPADKTKARARASELMPGAAHKWAEAKFDGRAEAAMIALFAAEQLGIKTGEVRTA